MLAGADYVVVVDQSVQALAHLLDRRFEAAHFAANILCHKAFYDDARLVQHDVAEADSVAYR